MTSQEDRLDRPALAELQRRRLRVLLDALPGNRFYARKFAVVGLSPAEVKTPADLARLPFTTKAELLADQAEHPPYGDTHPLPRERYSRLHQTSGTAGRPLRWLDTPDSWRGMLDCWDTMYRVAGIGPGDRLFFPFSFGPFLGFWTAFEAGNRMGCFCIPGGGMSTSARLRFLLEHEANVIFCTPTYALHLAEAAQSEGLDLANSAVRLLVVAGEPGGSVAATRGLIESAWGARLLDHAGMTEIGPCSIECPENRSGLHLIETHYVAEVIEPATGRAVPAGQVGELVLTNLVRHGSPLIRYRTGDLVKADPRSCPCGRVFLRLDGGILGRTDDMIHLRGNNVYPSALEAVIRRFPEIAEYRLEVDESQTLTELRVEVEPRDESSGADLAERVGRAIRDELLFRAEVRAVQPGSLPRFEMKARRLVRK